MRIVILFMFLLFASVHTWSQTVFDMIGKADNDSVVQNHLSNYRTQSFSEANNKTIICYNKARPDNKIAMRILLSRDVAGKYIVAGIAVFYFEDKVSKYGKFSGSLPRGFSWGKNWNEIKPAQKPVEAEENGFGVNYPFINNGAACHIELGFEQMIKEDKSSNTITSYKGLNRIVMAKNKEDIYATY